MANDDGDAGGGANTEGKNSRRSRGVDVAEFFHHFGAYTYHLIATPSALAYATWSVLEDMRHDGVVYAEIRTTPRAILGIRPAAASSAASLALDADTADLEGPATSHAGESLLSWADEAHWEKVIQLPLQMPCLPVITRIQLVQNPPNRTGIPYSHPLAPSQTFSAHAPSPSRPTLLPSPPPKPSGSCYHSWSSIPSARS
jgi:hypothetical protein